MGEMNSIFAKRSEANKINSDLQTRRINRSGSKASSVDRILYLQRTIGNQAVSRLIRSKALQAKLRIGQPGDVYEQEADRVADEVMRMPEPEMQLQVDEEEEEEDIIQAKLLSEQITPLVQRQVEEKEEEILQIKESSKQSPAVSSNLETNIQSLKTEGTHLPESIRAFFKPRFGADFSNVRVHNDTQAANVARSVNARAFTVGKNIVFGAGQYAPQTNDGKRLLAHELTHVVQQTAGESFQTNLKSISKFINSGEQISRFLRIRGSSNFQDGVRNDLGQLRGIIGQNLLNTLRSYWRKTVEINEVDSVCATGQVNDIILVYYNPSRCPIAPRDDVWDGPSVPNAIYLAHELIHALHHIEGTHNSSEPVEEWQTVGLGRYATLPTTENRIRCEMGLRLALRTFYYADDQQRYRLQGHNPPHC